MPEFPQMRLRRLRDSEAIRRLVCETEVNAGDLICPLFVSQKRSAKQEIPSMPGVYRYTVDSIKREAQEIAANGIGAVLLFGVPDKKDKLGSAAYSHSGVVQRAIAAIKDKVPELLVITDVCLCGYTNHGHCGVLDGERIDNDRTLELLAKVATSHAEAGADMVAPSAMMDGQVKAIREALDDCGFSHIPIMSYAAKYASAFYGPFREAAGSAPQFGDRRSYQMDPSNVRQALREVELDIAEGADIVMVKPALAYLDVIRAVSDRFEHPLAAYNVSGEYAMVKAAAASGWIDERQTVLEILTAIRRAGADIIITYHARDAARWLSDKA